MVVYHNTYTYILSYLLSYKAWFTVISKGYWGTEPEPHKKERGKITMKNIIDNSFLIRTKEELAKHYQIVTNKELREHDIKVKSDDTFGIAYDNYIYLSDIDIVSMNYHRKKGVWGILEHNTRGGNNIYECCSLPDGTRSIHVECAKFFCRNEFGYYYTGKDKNERIEVHHIKKYESPEDNRLDNIMLTEQGYHVRLLDKNTKEYIVNGKKSTLIDMKKESGYCLRTLDQIYNYQNECKEDFAFGVLKFNSKADCNIFADVLYRTDTNEILNISSYCYDYYFDTPDLKEPMQKFKAQVEQFVKVHDVQRYNEVACFVI